MPRHRFQREPYRSAETHIGILTTVEQGGKNGLLQKFNPMTDKENRGDVINMAAILAFRGDAGIMVASNHLPGRIRPKGTNIRAGVFGSDTGLTGLIDHHDLDFA